jgi:hypothetical protein
VDTAPARMIPLPCFTLSNHASAELIQAELPEISKAYGEYRYLSGKDWADLLAARVTKCAASSQQAPYSRMPS